MWQCQICPLGQSYRSADLFYFEDLRNDANVCNLVTTKLMPKQSPIATTPRLHEKQKDSLGHVFDSAEIFVANRPLLLAMLTVFVILEGSMVLSLFLLTQRGPTQAMTDCHTRKLIDAQGKKNCSLFFSLFSPLRLPVVCRL